MFFNFEVLFLIFVQSYEDRGIADSVKSNQGTLHLLEESYPYQYSYEPGLAKAAAEDNTLSISIDEYSD